MDDDDGADYHDGDDDGADGDDDDYHDDEFATLIYVRRGQLSSLSQ